ncbi:cysteine-rich small domain-containing protein [Agathobaculum sp.]|uniref:cysteine-rich small domain-containing protein n=1 Tax=Agathobaculum sp. TaxID=2048138 RepID=UPI002A7F7E47|nr:cysteine-rich small domain-containing protein [Agathobaculum sp.]MDY3619049.1 cysteine-rich small domain-containing protein [Agathobaculum sp.]
MAQKESWEGKSYSFFQNRACEFFPCHKTERTEDFNCLFCYCPLYTLGRECGGNFRYLENGIKDCSNCLLPHRRESYGYITKRFGDIAAAMQRQEDTKE